MKFLTIRKRTIFKICYSRNLQISVRKTNVFPRQAIPIFLFHNIGTNVILIPSLVWFGQLLYTIKRPIFKIRYSRSSQIAVSKPNLFPRQAITKILSVLCFSYTRDTPYQVWFNLDRSLTRWKKPNFKIRYPQNSQISVRKANFFSRQAIQKKLSVLNCNYTGDTP